MNPSLYYALSVVLALLLHGGVIVLMLTNWQSEKSIPVEDKRLYYLEASVVNENPHLVKKEKEKKNNAQKRKRRQDRLAAEEAKRQTAISRKRLELAKLKEETERQALEEEENRQKTIDQSAIIDAQRQVQKSNEQTELERREMAKELDMAIQGEQLALRAITDDEKASAFVGQIQREIVQNWSRPPTARNGMQAILRVFLVPTGDVVNVVVEESSGNDAFDRSAILAVNKARRFIVPTDSRQFEKNFRQFVVLFRPEDLRL
ncbi:MAG: colicin import membrane protein [Candidatus Azotimanducaceae bacterium]|jgi:colicin import membrane protein